MNESFSQKIIFQLNNVTHSDSFSEIFEGYLPSALISILHLTTYPKTRLLSTLRIINEIHKIWFFKCLHAKSYHLMFIFFYSTRLFTVLNWSSLLIFPSTMLSPSDLYFWNIHHILIMSNKYLLTSVRNVLILLPE